MLENGSSASKSMEPQPHHAQANHGTSMVNSSDNAVCQTEQIDGGSEPPANANDSGVTTADESNKISGNSDVNKWPGWPGDCVFRLVVPVLKVGSIIGRKGELIKKMCEETRARIRVLDGPNSSPDRIVLISGKEEPEVPLSPAMNAVIKVFKRVSGLPEAESGNKTPGTAGAYCSIRLLVASTQAINLIGKQGSLIKSIQESTGSVVRVLSNDVPAYVGSDERIVELQGGALQVLKALEAVVGHLRKFLVDHSVLPLFEKSYNVPISLEREVESSWPDRAPLLHPSAQAGRVTEYSLPVKRDSFLFDRESQLESQVSSSLSLYGQDPALSGIRTSGIGRPGVPIVTQVTHTMQIPLAYAEDIIGIAGANIGYIRRSSGAILTVQESRGLPDEITVEIKGTSSQVQVAQQLIEEFMSGPAESRSLGGQLDGGLRPSLYSQVTSSSSYTPSLYSGQPYGGYGSSGVGGYNSFRI